MAGKGVTRRLAERPDFLAKLLPFVAKIIRQLGTLNELANFGGFTFKLRTSEAGVKKKHLEIYYHRAIKPELVLELEYGQFAADDRTLFFDTRNDWQYDIGHVMVNKAQVVIKFEEAKIKEEKRKAVRSRLDPGPKKDQ